MIVAEQLYRMSKEKHETLLKDDPYSYAQLNALVELSKDHKCVFIGLSETPFTMDFHGVEMRMVYDNEAYVAEMRKLDPELLISYTAPHTVWRATRHIHKSFKLIQKLPCEASSIVWPDATYTFRKADAVLPCFDYEIEIVRAFGASRIVEAVPWGVNFELIDKHFKKEREYDICCAINNPFKGWELARQVMESLKERCRVHPLVNICDMRKPHYLEELSKCQFVFMPTATEGSARTVSEAARLGCIPIVSTDSQNVCYHLKDIHHHELRTWCWANRTVDESRFFQDPLRLANQIQATVMHNLTDYQRPVDIGSQFDVRNEVQSIVRIARQVLG
jgi:hypothetical protein